MVATPWSAAHQAPPSMGFSRQEYWSGVPLPSPPEQPRTSHILCAQHPSSHGYTCSRLPLYLLLSSHHDPFSSFTNKQSSFVPQDLSTSYLLFSLPEIFIPLSLTLMTLSDLSGLTWNGSSSESPFQYGLDPSHSPDSYFSR